jgi:OOP family OmpA-OmpF porin
MFSDTNALGSTDANDAAAEPVHLANSAFFGLRLGYMFTDVIGAEVEGGLIPTETTGPQGTVVFDVWNLTVRGDVIGQFRASNPSNKILPFVLVGGGLMNVVDIGTTDDSLWDKGDQKWLAYAGVGAKYRAGGNWGVRLDARVYLVPAMESGVTQDFEILLSLYKAFGVQAPVVETKKEEPKTGADDPDNDGVVGDADKCAGEPEDKDGFQDEDGCPDADNDADGIADATDKCAGEPEDKDNFQDEDGCPDLDNDGDGVPDAADKCADQPETMNGVDDGDGCPDEVPAKLSAVMGVAAGVSFKVNTADLLPASNKTLDKVAAALTEFATVKVEVAAHTDDQALKAGGKFPDNEALSQARAEAVKQYLVKKGVAEDRIVAKGYAATAPVQDPAGLTGAKLAAARKANQRVEIKLVSAAAAPAAPAAEPKAEEPKAEEKK